MNFILLLSRYKFIIISAIIALIISGFSARIYYLNYKIKNYETKIEKLESNTLLLESNIENLNLSLEGLRQTAIIVQDKKTQEVQELKKLLNNCSKKQPITKVVEIEVENCKNKAIINIDRLDENSTDSLKILGEIGK